MRSMATMLTRMIPVKIIGRVLCKLRPSYLGTTSFAKALGGMLGQFLVASVVHDRCMSNSAFPRPPVTASMPFGIPGKRTIHRKWVCSESVEQNSLSNLNFPRKQNLLFFWLRQHQLPSSRVDKMIITLKQIVSWACG